MNIKKTVQWLAMTLLGAVVAGGVASAASIFFPYQGGTGTSSTPDLFQLMEGNGSGIYRVTSSPTFVPCARWQTSTLGLWASVCLNDTQSMVVPFEDLLVNGNFETWNATNSTPVAWTYFTTPLGGEAGDGTVIQSKNTTDCNDASSCVQQIITSNSDDAPQAALLQQEVPYDPTKAYTGHFEFKRNNNNSSTQDYSCALIANFDFRLALSDNTPAWGMYWNYASHGWSNNFDEVVPNGFFCSGNPTTGWQTLNLPTITGDNATSSAFFVNINTVSGASVTETILTDNAAFGLAESSVTTGTKQFIFTSPSNAFPFRFSGAQANFDNGVSTTALIFASSTDNTGKVLQIVDTLGHVTAVPTSSLFSFTDVWGLNGSSAYYNNGNVGIGTSTPTQKLEVVGNVKLNNIYGIGDMSNPFRIYGGFAMTTSGSVIEMDGNNIHNYINATGAFSVIADEGRFDILHVEAVNKSVSTNRNTIDDGNGNTFTYGSSTIARNLMVQGNIIGGSSIVNGSSDIVYGPNSVITGDYNLSFNNFSLLGDDNIGLSLDHNANFGMTGSHIFSVMGGNVGFGTTTPSENLTVVGTASFGHSNVAPGTDAFVAGLRNKAVGDYSAVIAGQDNQALGTNDLIYGGHDNIIDSLVASSVILGGFQNQISADSCLILGGAFNSCLSGADNATVFGLANTASGTRAFVFGKNNVAGGSDSLAVGQNLTVSGDSSIGFNLSTTTPEIIANPNTFAILGGNVGIRTTAPTKSLDVVGEIRSSATSTASCFTTDGINCITSGSPTILATTTPSLGGGLLTIGTCASVDSILSGVSTTMSIATTPRINPGDGSYWYSFVSAPDTITTKLCAVASITPTASAYNLRIIP